MHMYMYLWMFRYLDNVWCGKVCLKEDCLVLYNIASAKDASVSVNMDYSSGSLQWNACIIHLTYDWELMSLLRFLLVLI
jgi:hypothetical protein